MKNKKFKTRLLSKKNRTILLFNIPAYIFLIILTVIPLIYTFYVSLLRYNLANPPNAFIGLGNYHYLITNDIFWQSLTNTLIFTFSSLLLICLTSFSLALLLNESIRVVRKLRALIVMPWAIPSIVIGIIWVWIFESKYGIANYLLNSIGFNSLSWLLNPTLAMISVIIARSWHEITFGTLIFLVGLQSIPQTTYEAAKIDGAGTLNRFLYITLPLLRNSIAIILVFETIWCLREFPIIYAMTYGGPGNATTVLGWLTYKFSFLYYDFGKGAAVAVVLGVITLILSIAIIKIFYRKQEV